MDYIEMWAKIRLADDSDALALDIASENAWTSLAEQGVVFAHYTDTYENEEFARIACMTYTSQTESKGV